MDLRTLRNICLLAAISSCAEGAYLTGTASWQEQTLEEQSVPVHVGQNLINDKSTSESTIIRNEDEPSKIRERSATNNLNPYSAKSGTFPKQQEEVKYLKRSKRQNYDDSPNLLNCPGICDYPESMYTANMCKLMGCKPQEASRRKIELQDDEQESSANGMSACPESCESPDDESVEKVCKEIGCSLIANPQLEVLHNKKNSFGQKNSKQVTSQLNPNICPGSCKSPATTLLGQWCIDLGCLPNNDGQGMTKPAGKEKSETEIKIPVTAKPQQDLSDIKLHITQLNPNICSGSCKSPATTLIGQWCIALGCTPNSDGQGTSVTDRPKLVFIKDKAPQTGSVQDIREEGSSLAEPEYCPHECISPVNDLMKKACIDIGCLHKSVAQETGEKKSPKLVIINKNTSHTSSGQVISTGAGTLFDPENCPHECTFPVNDLIRQACVDFGCLPNNDGQGMTKPAGKAKSETEIKIPVTAKPQQDLSDIKLHITQLNPNICPGSCKSPATTLIGKWCKDLGCIPNSDGQGTSVTDRPKLVFIKDKAPQTGSVQEISEEASSLAEPEYCPHECISPVNDLMKKACKDIGCLHKSDAQETGEKKSPKFVIINKNTSHTSSGQEISTEAGTLFDPENCPYECTFPVNDLIRQACVDFGCLPNNDGQGMTKPAGKAKSETEIKIPVTAKPQQDLSDIKLHITQLNPNICPGSCKSPATTLIGKWCKDLGCIPNSDGQGTSVTDRPKLVFIKDKAPQNGSVQGISKEASSLAEPEYCPHECISPVNDLIETACIDIGCLHKSDSQEAAEKKSPKLVIINKNTSHTSSGQEISTRAGTLFDPENCPYECTFPVNDLIRQACVDFGCLPNNDGQGMTKPAGKEKSETEIKIPVTTKPQQDLSDIKLHITQLNPNICSGSCKSPATTLIGKWCIDLGCIPNSDGQGTSVTDRAKLVFIKDKAPQNGSVQEISEEASSLAEPEYCPHECISPVNDLMKKACIDIGCLHKSDAQETGEKKSPKLVIINKNTSHTSSGQEISTEAGTLFDPENCPYECTFPINDLIRQACVDFGCLPNNDGQGMTKPAGKSKSETEIKIPVTAKPQQDLSDIKLHITQLNPNICPGSCKSPATTLIGKWCIDLGCIPNSDGQGTSVTDRPKLVFIKDKAPQTGSVQEKSEEASSLAEPEYCPHECISPVSDLIETACINIGCLHTSDAQETGEKESPKLVVINKKTSETESGQEMSNDAGTLFDPENCPYECTFPVNDLIRQACIDIGCSQNNQKEEVRLPDEDSCPIDCIFPRNDKIRNWCVNRGCDTEINEQDPREAENQYIW